MSQLAEYVPEQDWEALLERSVTRGAALRRRRHLLGTVPVIAGVVLGMGALVASSGARSGQGPTRLDIVTHPTDPAPQPTSYPLTPNAVVAAPGHPTAAPSQVAGRAAAVTHPAQVAVRPPRARSLPVPLPVLRYDDPVGDGVTQGTGAPAGQPQPGASDIVQMQWVAGAQALQITMTLAGAPDNAYQYDAFVVDPKTQCSLDIHLGTAPQGGYYLVCNGETVSTWVPTTPVTVHGASLVATLPWSMFPEQVDPRRPMTTSGGAYVTNPANPLQTDGAFSARRISRTGVS